MKLYYNKIIYFPDDATAQEGRGNSSVQSTSKSSQQVEPMDDYEEWLERQK